MLRDPPSSPPAARCVIESHIDEDQGTALAEDVLDGLTRPFKELPPKYLYDERGARLFEQICELPEYYPTRTERSILEREAARLAELTEAAELVELGSGSAAKTRLLLDALDAQGTLRRYVPLDVAEPALVQSVAALADAYPRVAMHGVVCDFERHLEHVPPPVGRRLLAFLGGTIGNFAPGSRRRFLRHLGRLLGPRDFLLLGTDLVKDHGRLRRAYDDTAGVTAEFNRNMLHVINRELGADFIPEEFEHVALFDPHHEWIEMRLRARTRHVVRIPAIGLEVRFRAGEDLRTEISAKFTRRRVEDDVAAAGLELVAWLTDPEDQFALSLIRRAD